MDQMTYHITPIGQVQNRNGSFSLSILPAFRKGLSELKDFSHIQVLWWSHLHDSKEKREQIVYEKPYTKGPEHIGVFATRSPMRPNPIALSTCQVISINYDEGRIHLTYLDAINETPLIDVKPYMPSIDRIKHPNSPNWCAHWPQWFEESGDFDWGAEMTDDLF